MEAFVIGVYLLTLTILAIYGFHRGQLVWLYWKHRQRAPQPMRRFEELPVVTVQLPNWPEMCMLQIALSRVGAVIQPMHTVYREREMENMLRFCDARAVFVPGAYQGFEHAAAVTGMRDALPDLEFAISVGAEGGDVTYADLLARGAAAQPMPDTNTEFSRFTSSSVCRNCMAARIP